jgi:hypothetical protein
MKQNEKRLHVSPYSCKDVVSVAQASLRVKNQYSILMKKLLISLANPLLFPTFHLQPINLRMLQHLCQTRSSDFSAIAD